MLTVCVYVNGGVCMCMYVFMTHDSEFQKKLLRYELLLLLQNWKVSKSC